ncbi:unnamed protein product, partial [marine sediment metagenome]
FNYAERPVSNAIIITYKDWSLAKAFSERKLFSSSKAKLTKNAFRKIVIENSELTPVTYVQKPEDYGLYGINQIYKKVIEPIIPEALIRNKKTYKLASFFKTDALFVFSQGRSRSALPK